MNKCSNVAIVGIFYDGYEDMWDDCVQRVEKYWPNHPPMYVFTNAINKDWKNVKTIPCGTDAEWSKKIQKTVSVVNEDYIILLLEDFFVGSNVNNQLVDDLILFMNKNNIDYCKLCELCAVHFKTHSYQKGYPYDVIYADEPYGISLQPAIWKKSFLKEKVGDLNYNAWAFEAKMKDESAHNVHSATQNLIFARGNILNIKHGALQGKMIPSTVKYFTSINNPLKTDRAMMNFGESFRSSFEKAAMVIIRPKYREKIKSLAKFFGKRFITDKWRLQQ